MKDFTRAGIRENAQVKVSSFFSFLKNSSSFQYTLEQPRLSH